MKKLKMAEVLDLKLYPITSNVLPIGDGAYKYGFPFAWKQADSVFFLTVYKYPLFDKRLNRFLKVFIRKYKCLYYSSWVDSRHQAFLQI